MKTVTKSIPDFVRIRRGTDTYYALVKCYKIVRDNILSNGKNLKQENGFTINFIVHPRK